MRRRTKRHLNEIEHYDVAAPFDGLTYVLRTDAHHATASLKKSLAAHFNPAANPDSPRPALKSDIKNTVHKAYRLWGRQVLKAMADNLDYASYGIESRQNRFLNVHFYNARQLAERAVQKGYALVHGQRSADRPVFFISLDDMITQQTPYWGDLAFSRQFNPETSDQIAYRARPGTKPLMEQLETLTVLAAGFKRQHGYKLPVVLLEDNVRRASMINMIIMMMQSSDLFNHAELAGISTCFCCADQDELNKIRRADQSIIPVTRVVDYNGAKIDVTTPRDLLFDGYAVGLQKKGENTVLGEAGRLPAVFMDAARLFRIAPAKAELFNAKILKANLGFCERLEQQFKVDLKLGWFTGATAISHYTGHHPDTRMADVLRANDNAQKQLLRQRAP